MTSPSNEDLDTPHNNRPKSKAYKLIVATLKLGGMDNIKTHQAATILSRYLRVK